MNHNRLPMIVACIAVLAAAPAAATITGVRAMPRQVNLVASGSNLLSINWQVSTTTDHGSGVSSATGSIVDPGSGAILQRIDVSLSAAGGGPFLLRELISLDAATVRAWTDQGLRRVVLERAFVDPASGALSSATVVLGLSRSRLESTRDAAPGELSVVSLRLEFDSGNNAVVTTTNEALRARLTVQYTGTGILHGRWQIAEPESSEGPPSFRTMRLVNANLQTSQRSILQSPVLPTARNGKYILRFCVADPDGIEPAGDLQCPDVAGVVTATYHVQGREDDGIGVIGGISPDRQAVSAGTPFSWPVVAAAAVYQLQIFEPAPAAAGLPASRTDGDGMAPRFVTGMLLDATTGNTPLSGLVRSRLQAGQRYLWRVTAHDDTGRMIGSSAEASFVYRPGE